ncbi:hypothetical protein MKEN_00544200 [Mycena kentingensis (nom. inval.)]|nr:hypothetical protein MKEN_00544200 [Mycena kentingensis (nom. inval.)]
MASTESTAHVEGTGEARAGDSTLASAPSTTEHSKPTTAAALTANLSPEAAAKLKAAAAVELQRRKDARAQTQTQTSAAAELDAAILARIFSLVSYVPLPSTEPHGTTEDGGDQPDAAEPAAPTPKTASKHAHTPSPKPHRLLPLLLINRHWNAIGTPLLYARISLTGRTGEWVAKKLRRTLENGAIPAALVRSLVLDIELAEDEDAETGEHVRILRACAPGLRELTILGYAAGHEAAYKDAVGACRALRTLNISEGAEGLFTWRELVGLVGAWPALERMVLRDVLRDARGGSEDAAQGQNPRLKMVKIIDTFAPAQAVEFVQFAKAAPGLEVLWVEQRRVSGEKKLPEDLFAALEIWKETLEGLCVLTDAEVHLETILPSLTALKQLDVSALVLNPTISALSAATPPSSVPAPPPPTLSPASALQNLKPSKGVHTLTYHRLPPGLLTGLAEALAQPGVFPALRCVVLKDRTKTAREEKKPKPKEKPKGKSKSVYGVPLREEQADSKPVKVHWDNAAGTPLSSESGYPPSAVQAFKTVGRKRRIRVVL